MSIVDNKAATKILLSEQEYLAYEQNSEARHELINGEVIAMTGATINHDRIIKNLSRHFGNHLDDSSCEVLGQDIKVKVGSNFYYPDLLVDCDVQDANSLFSHNPKIIVEVLSSSTSKYDRTTKRVSYLNIPSLEEYVLIEQEFAFVEVMRRSDNWKASQYNWEDEIYFAAIDLSLKVQDIYKRVDNEHINELRAELK